MRTKPVQLELFPEKGREYMYHKSEIDHSDEEPAKATVPEGERIAKTWEFPPQDSPVCRAFPEVAAGNAFLDKASRLSENWEAFHAMAVGLDPPPSEPGGEGKQVPDLEAMVAAAEIVEETCASFPGFWGILRADRVACLFESGDAQEMLKLGERIREAMKRATGKTVCVGVAVHPLLDYRRDEAIANAGKALEHAGLLGSDSMSEFDAVSLNVSGDRLYQKGDLEGAAKEFQAALRLDPENANVINSLGVCYAAQGEHRKALAEFEKAMELDPADVMAHYNAGLACSMIDEKEKSLELFSRAFELDPESFEAALRIGRLHLERKAPRKALPYLEKAAAIDRESGPAHRLLGECLNELGRPQEAIRAYSAAIKSNANDAYSLSALGLLYARQGVNTDIAVVFCRQSVDLVPESDLFRQRLGEALFLLERFEEALAELRKACDLGRDCREMIDAAKERISAETP